MRKEESFSRRSLIKAASGTAIAMPWIVPATALGLAQDIAAPSERVTMAWVGCGGRGNYDMSRLVRHGAQPVALCDVNRQHLDSARRAYKVPKSACSGDFRETVARQDVDAVLVTTNDHWHVLTALAALRAHKDIYVEKPLGITIQEGRTLVKAVQKTDRVFMHGTEQRSMASVRRVCELVRNGRIGRVRKVTVWCPGGRTSSPAQAAPVPEWLDFDMYTGPAPKREFDARRIVPQFHWHISDYVPSGFLAGWGIHNYDIMHWALDLDHTGPVTIEGQATYPPKGELCDCPVTWKIVYSYAGGLTMDFMDSSTFSKGDGIKFEGDDGWIQMHYGGASTASDIKILASKIDANEVRLYDAGRGDDNYNFLQCVKSRKPTCSPIEAAHRSSSVGFLGGIACQLKRKLQWDPAEEIFPGDDEANKLLSRPMRGPWKLDA
jgi:predicted dehydrogenase